SIAAVMAKPPAARPEGNTAGKVPKPGAGNSKFGGRVVSPVKRGLVLGVSTPAGFVTDVESPKDRVPESAFVASAPPMRPETSLLPQRIASLLLWPPVSQRRNGSFVLGE